MSPSRAEIRAQRAAAAEARRQAKAGGGNGPEGEAPAEGPEVTPAAAAVVPASREAEPETSPVVPVVRELQAYRPQPFTPDLIPEPEDLDVQGPMTDEELVELSYCEAAYTNADKADWIKWMAAESVRRGKRFRGADGTRTWPEYCEEVFGESESEVNRSIQQWPLKRAIATQQTAKPLSTPSSHVQALLPVVAEYGGEEEVARNYLGMRTWAAENKVKVTAADLESWVQRAQAAVDKPAERPALTGESLLEVREERVRQKQQAKSAAKTKTPKDTEPPATEPEAAPDAAPEAEAEPETHPNLGDQAPDQGGDEEHQEPEAETAGAGSGGDEQEDDAVDPRVAQVAVAASQLAGMSEGFVETGLLQLASTETLKTIVEATRSLAEAAEEELATR
ncbi:hypothetical protein ACFY12_34185 [Streptomyces sp. NPDC001339]|uniref:hypothetical protein n=1 Tax=Streptomyces sp. NPDC001339 TaxID=3364563 RepID=UPI0036823A19